MRLTRLQRLKRERMARGPGMELLVWHKPEAMPLGIHPFDRCPL
jgi:hypothetical protein